MHSFAQLALFARFNEEAMMLLFNWNGRHLSLFQAGFRPHQLEASVRRP
jgi:hypothetical protein